MGEEKLIPRPRRGSRLAGLTPDELEFLALQHVEDAFNELRAGQARIRQALSPVRAAGRHPVWVGAALALVGFWFFRRAPRPRLGPRKAEAPSSPRDSIGRSVARALLTSLAAALGKVVPGLVAGWLARRRPPSA